MKKHILAIMLAALAMPLSFASAYSTISFDRATVNAVPGQVFQVLVAVDPHADKNYTVKLALEYPADTLQVTNFSFASGWTQLNQPGYDAMDNVRGSLIKTAGFPGGFTAPKAFGTVTLKATKSGTATVKVGSGSLVLDGNNTNQLSGISSFSVVAEGAPVVAQNPATPAQATPNVVPKPSNPTTKETETAVAQQPSAAQTVQESPKGPMTETSEASTASLLGSITLGRVGIILAFLVIVLGGAFYLMRRRGVRE